jgi:import inner membrane translocase subunit TIM21
MRSTARTTNLTVILLGAGLSALLIYSLTTELFSKNSPTVLYGDACERIKASPKVCRCFQSRGITHFSFIFQIAKYLNGPLSFHNNPPSAVRPRHRNRHVVSQIMVDPYGQEHMIMTFYVQGQPPGNDTPQSESSFLDSATEWANDKISVLSELTLDETITWTKEQTATLWDRTKRLIKYLSGSALPPPPLPTLPSNSVDQRKSEESSAWNFAGMFSSLKGSRGGPVEPISSSDGRTFTDGQVHASFIRVSTIYILQRSSLCLLTTTCQNKDGYFVFRYLLVDMSSMSA